MNKRLLLLWLMGMILLPITRAQVCAKDFSLPDVISSNMVLQQGQDIPIWGTATPGERIKILFDKKRMTVRADKNGNWKVMLPAMLADKLSHTLTISTKDTAVIYRNILIGEVWLCAGQSNMEYRMKLIPQFAPPAKGIDLAAEELKKPDNEMIRVFISDHRKSWKEWKVAGSKSLPGVSAAGYFFGKKLQEDLDVPIGIITVAIGGTRIETWTPREEYESSSLFAPMLDQGRIQGIAPGEIYQNLLQPVIPYGIKGFLWYQGENNCGIDDRLYTEKFRLMAERWRKDFGQPKAPFYYVLLAPHIYSDRMHRHALGATTAESLPLFRQQQICVRDAVPHCEYVSISDLVDDLRDIHPSYKWEVGNRLARVALSKNYGQDSIVWSGPRIKSWEIQNHEAIITFEHCGEGLKTNDVKLVGWFEIGTDEGGFSPAVAEIINKNQVKVYRKGIYNPTKVRLGWHETAMPNLVNSEGLPAVPFSTSEIKQ